jgi:hypothetical protein
MKLSIDNLLSSDILNTSGSGVGGGGGGGGVNNLSHTDSPHLHGQQARQQLSPAHHTMPARKSSNNILSSHMGSSNENDSPTLCNSYSQNVTTVNLTNARLSTDRLLNGNGRSNISNNNLSTSASLLDATTDDAMSSK